MEKLHNTYFALRHGESKANTEEIIISSMKDAANETYTLTENGEQQVKNSVTQAKENKLLNNEVIIYSSPFSRCKKTAQIAKEILHTKEDIIIDDRLRERSFGDLDGTNAKNYEKVWQRDAKEVAPEANEEPMESVLERTTSLISDLEKEYSDKVFLLVSHGDVLQILETYFKDIPASQHRSIVPLERGELRKLN